jgi:hypothetical protein
MTVWLVTGIVVDGCITLCITYYLIRDRNTDVVSYVHNMYLFQEKFAN